MALGYVSACLVIFIRTKLGPWVIRTSKRNSLTHTFAFLTKGNFNTSNDSINGTYWFSFNHISLCKVHSLFYNDTEMSRLVVDMDKPWFTWTFNSCLSRNLSIPSWLKVIVASVGWGAVAQCQCQDLGTGTDLDLGLTINVFCSFGNFIVLNCNLFLFSYRGGSATK